MAKSVNSLGSILAARFMSSDIATVRLPLQGLGLILYSPFAAAHIGNGEDYFQTHFLLPQDVAAHVNRGTISAFGTGSPGNYTIRLFAEIDETLFSYECKLALCLEIRDRTLCIRDVYDLMEWDAACPTSQKVELDDGYYYLRVCTNVPASGILGDNQVIDIFLWRRSTLPKIAWNGVPNLQK
jgi:hypothetical protein